MFPYYHLVFPVVGSESPCRAGLPTHQGLFQQFWEQAPGQNWEKKQLNIKIGKN